MLSTSNLSVMFRGRAVLHDITVLVPRGSLVAILGPNGSGKTTLLRALAGDIQPSRGQVALAGVPLSRWSLQERAQRRAVLEQEFSLSFPLRCLDVVLLGRLPHQPRARTAQHRLDDLLIARAALDAVDQSDRADDSYDVLSGGQKQLVQLARALAQIWSPPPGSSSDRCLLLDEPTASLDLHHQHLILSRAHHLSREGVAVLAILHDINLAAQYADTVVLLKGGRVAAQGRPSDVLQPATIHDVFGIPATRIDVGPHPVIVPLVSIDRSTRQGQPPTRYTRHVDLCAEHPVRAT